MTKKKQEINIPKVRKNYVEREKKRNEHDLASEFLAIVSHELRTPLAIIKEGLSLIVDEDLGPINPQQSKALNLSLSSINRLNRLVNEILDISRLEKGKVKLTKKVFDLALLSEEVFKGIEALAQKENRIISFQETVDREELFVYGDQDKIIQVLINIAHNALKYTPEQGLVKFSITDKHEFAFLSILDQGPGISKEEIPLVFKKFHQIEKHKKHGLGLGLAIAKEIIELHGGKISIKSKLGQGTEFIISFPLVVPFLEQIVKVINRETLSQSEIEDIEQYGIMKLLIETMEYTGLDIDEREELLKALEEMKWHKGHLPSIWDHIEDFRRIDIKDEKGNPLHAKNYKEAFLMAYIEKNMGEFKYQGKHIYEYGNTNEKRKALMSFVKELSLERLEQKLQEIGDLNES